MIQELVSPTFVWEDWIQSRALFLRRAENAVGADRPSASLLKIRTLRRCSTAALDRFDYFDISTLQKKVDAVLSSRVPSA